MVDPNDAKALTNPIMVLASKDEPAEDIKKFEAELSEEVRAKSVVKTYDTMHHGYVSPLFDKRSSADEDRWAAARADLDDKENLAKFQEAYEELAGFFNKYVSK